MKRLLSLNLALVMLFTMLPMGTLVAAAADGDTGYATFYKNDESETAESVVVEQLASNGRLELYYYAPNFTASEKVVTGYNTAEDGTGTEYAFSDLTRDVFSSDESAPIELYAQWEDAPGNHVLYISTDGVTAEGKDYILSSGLSDTAVLLSENTFIPENDGKVVGWSTHPYYSKGTFYKCEETVDVSENLTLYSVVGVNCITLHYLQYNYSSKTYEDSEKTNVYTSAEEEIGGRTTTNKLNDRIFVGWNTKEDGSGTWYTTNDLAIDAPQDLYAQYEEYPDNNYYILDANNGALLNGQQKDIIELPDDCLVTLPKEMRNGAIAAYWYNSRNELYYPTEEIVCVNNGATITAAIVDMSNYYGIIDGNGGVTDSGSKYSATSCYVTSAGSLSVYSFNDAVTFTSEIGSIVGYKGEKTQTIYEMNDVIWDAMEAEADENNIARFTAQYEGVTGGYIQYFGNGSQTESGDTSVVQDGLDFTAITNEKYLENSFVAPDGKYFIGWNTDAGGSGEWYDAGELIALSSNTVLYAQWGTNRVTYHYTWNNKDRERVVANRGIYSEMSGSDDIFAGWNTAKDGSGSWYCRGEAIPAGSILDLYEQYIILPETEYYYLLQGSKLSSGKMAELVLMDAETATVTLPDIGFAWKNADATVNSKGFFDAEENIYFPGSEIEITSGTELLLLEAQTVAEYRSNYDGYEATRVYYNLASHSALVLHAADEVFDTLPTDAVFNSWNTKADGTGTSYETGSYLYDGEYTLYAQWNDASDNNVASGTCGDNLTWVLTENGLLTISGTGAMVNYGHTDNRNPWFDFRELITSVIIYEGITSIGSYAFYCCENLTKITIPDGIVSVGYGSFYHCEKLRSVTLPKTVTKIGGEAFYSCYALNAINIPEGISILNRYTFRNCSSLEQVVLPSNLSKIESAAFQFCEKLGSANIPEAVKTIGESAFEYCALKTVDISSNVTSIGSGAFSGNESLKNITVEENNANYTSQDGVLFNKSKTKLLQYPAGSSYSSYTIPDGVTEIDINAFASCQNLSHVAIPSSMNTIGRFSFACCDSMISISIPNSVTAIESDAFFGCSNLSSLVFPDTLECIGDSAFYSCNALREVIVPESVKAIEKSAFYLCRGLTSVTLSAGVETIGKYAFFGTDLTDVIFLGDVPTMESNAFSSVVATCYYPASNNTWTEAVMQNYGGNLTWVAMSMTKADLCMALVDFMEWEYTADMTMPFIDVSKEHEAYEAICILCDHEVFSAEFDKSFRPDSALTREQAAMIICYTVLGKRMSNALMPTKQKFNDVAIDRWSAAYIEYCTNVGFMSGYNDGSFGPVRIAAEKDIHLTKIVPSKNVTVSIDTIENKVYNGNAFTPDPVLIVDGLADGEQLVKDTDYTVSYSNNTNAGVATVTVTAKAGSNYTFTMATQTFTIEKQSVDIPSANTGLVYTGSELTGVTLPADAKYTLSGNVQTNVGNYTAIATLNDSANYKWKGASENESVPQNIAWYITKAAAPALTVSGTVSFKYTVTGNKSVTIQGVPANAGEASWSVGEVTDVSGVLSGTPAVSNGVVSFVLNGLQAYSEGITAIIPVSVSMDNYADALVNVVICIKDRDIPVVSVDNLSVTYTGKELTDADIQGTSNVAGSWVWVTKPAGTAARETPYSAQVKFIPTNLVNYAEVTKDITVTIRKATPSGTPDYTSIGSGKTLADVNLKPGTLAPAGGTLVWLDKDGNPVADPSTVKVEANQEYTWQYTVDANYTVLTGEITPYVYVYIPSGSGGVTSSTTTPNTNSPTVSTNTTTNEDGSTTVTETKKDGTIVETTTGVDGSSTTTASKTKTTTRWNGTTTTTTTSNTTSTDVDGNVTTEKKVEKMVKNKDGSAVTTTTTTTKDSATGTTVTTKTEVKIAVDADGTMTTTATTETKSSNGSKSTASVNADGKAEVKVTVSSSAARTAEKDGEPISLPMPAVSATAESVTAPTVAIKVPAFTKSVLMEIPVANVTTSTVAVIVNTDGSETVVNATKMTENGVVVNLVGSTSVKIMDNSMTFTDVTEEDWEKKAVDFASSRNLVNGVGNNRFDLDGLTSYAHVVTVLARLAGEDTSPEENQQWYDKGVAWAVENGVAYAGNVNEAVTRQFMVNILWRIAGAPESAQDFSHFADAGDVTAENEAAIRWAVEIGLVQGNGNGTMTPNGTVTRGQFVQFLMNFIQLT